MRAKVSDFLNQLRTGKSPIMLLLDGVLADPAALQSHPHFKDFREDDHVDVICTGCREWLGLSDEQVVHINGWPAALKERIRKAIVTAIEEGHNIEFFWGVTSKPVEQAEVMEWPSGATTVRLASPEDVVRLGFDDGGRNVEIEVGEASDGKLKADRSIGWPAGP